MKFEYKRMIKSNVDIAIVECGELTYEVFLTKVPFILLTIDDKTYMLQSGIIYDNIMKTLQDLVKWG